MATFILRGTWLPVYSRCRLVEEPIDVTGFWAYDCVCAFLSMSPDLTTDSYIDWNTHLVSFGG